ncbi:PREDICTED: uncharacterized protein LOC108357513 [Rhagoletis zephyria]|uniref:uncharacterized protein LOC108357513 n=1 Tax=Rhagoletis zephyria TaxID=28612 RepID=UPI000811AA91|nr:PREDICTED: uncharacterized protein LOC108357513 [Rhagoletis zephyria]
MFGWSVLWAVASNFKDAEKDGFERHIREVVEGDTNFDFPPGSIWDYYINMDTGKWENWNSIIEQFHFDTEMKYFDMQVPTVDTTKYGTQFSGAENTGFKESVCLLMLIRRVGVNDLVECMEK